MQAQQTIQALVAPVVMISANGLICLALYNRLAAVTSRARAFHKESFDLIARLSAMDPQRRGEPEARHLRRRIRLLDEMGHRMIVRARWLRDSLYCLLVTVLCMIGCSIALGIAGAIPWMDWAAVALFYTGAGVMMLGIIAAILELRGALDPLKLEHRAIDEVHADVHAASKDAAQPGQA